MSFKLIFVDLAEGDSLSFYDITKEKIYFINKRSNTSLVMNKWITLCWDKCAMRFVSDHQLTGRGFYMELYYHMAPSKYDDNKRPFSLTLYKLNV